MKFCPECGSKNEGFKFCPSCGFKFGEIQIVSNQPFEKGVDCSNKILEVDLIVTLTTDNSNAPVLYSIKRIFEGEPISFQIEDQKGTIVNHNFLENELIPFSGNGTIKVIIEGSDDFTYKGEFKNGKAEGIGTLRYGDDGLYIYYGSFKANSFNGEGIRFKDVYGMFEKPLEYNSVEF